MDEKYFRVSVVALHGTILPLELKQSFVTSVATYASKKCLKI